MSQDTDGHYQAHHADPNMKTSSTYPGRYLGMFVQSASVYHLQALRVFSTEVPWVYRVVFEAVVLFEPGFDEADGKIDLVYPAIQDTYLPKARYRPASWSLASPVDIKYEHSRPNATWALLEQAPSTFLPDRASIQNIF